MAALRSRAIFKPLFEVRNVQNLYLNNMNQRLHKIMKLRFHLKPVGETLLQRPVYTIGCFSDAVFISSRGDSGLFRTARRTGWLA